MGKIDMSKMQAKKDEITERMSGGGGDFEFYEIKDGPQVIRVLPPKGDNDKFWKETKIHFNVGGSGVVTCSKVFGHKCPVCDEIAKLKKSKSKEDQALAKKMRPSSRVYINIFERGNKEKVDVPQILNCGPTVLKCILDVLCDPEYGDVTDFNEGFDLTLTKTGKKLDTDYSVIPKRKESKASEKLTEKELDDLLPDLDVLVVEKSKEEILAIMDGESDSIDGDTNDSSDSVVDDTEVVDAEIIDDNDIEAQIRAEIEKNKK